MLSTENIRKAQYILYIAIEIKHFGEHHFYAEVIGLHEKQTQDDTYP